MKKLCIWSLNLSGVEMWNCIYKEQHLCFISRYFASITYMALGWSYVKVFYMGDEIIKSLKYNWGFLRKKGEWILVVKRNECPLTLAHQKDLNLREVCG